MFSSDVTPNREPPGEPSLADGTGYPYAFMETPDVGSQVVLVTVGATAVRTLYALLCCKVIIKYQLYKSMIYFETITNIFFVGRYFISFLVSQSLKEIKTNSAPRMIYLQIWINSKILKGIFRIFLVYVHIKKKNRQKLWSSYSSMSSTAVCC